MSDIAGYVVVLLAGSPCEAAPKDEPTRCVMEVIGPFKTREEADATASKYPAWTTPHMMTLNRPKTSAPKSDEPTDPDMTGLTDAPTD